MLELKNVSKDFQIGKSKVTVLRDIQLKISSGEVVSVIGASGSGKSTLLHIAGLVSSPTSGEVVLDCVRCDRGSDLEKSRRRGQFGFIYQFHHLLPEFTALENLLIPQLVIGISKFQALENSKVLLEKFGLTNLSAKRPDQMSGGENQRITILRAIVKRPKCILADEPTGSLDYDNASSVFEFLLNNAKSSGVATLIVTHNLSLAHKADRVITMEAGRIVE